MGRSSSTGLPFLVLRPDAGQYTYQRSIPGDIAALVTGNVELLWVRATRTLAGKPLVKISLKTGGEATARLRWAQIHPQIEALVQIARVRANGASAPKQAPVQVDRLTRDQISIMVAQAHHDILAEHDRGWIDPSFSSPLTAITTKLMLAKGAAMNPRTAEDARRQAQAILERQAKHALIARDVGSVDQRIEETDLDLDPTVFDLDALRSGRSIRPMTDQMAALRQAENAPVSTIPSDIDAILAENGLDLADDHPDRRRLGLEVLRAQVRANDVIKQRDLGAPIDTPERPSLITPPEVPIATVEAVSASRLRWIKLNRPSPKQIDDNALYVGSFIQLFGDLPVNEVTKKQVIAFRDKLRFVVDDLVGQDDLVIDREGAEHVRRLAVRESIKALAQRFTIDGDEPGRRARTGPVKTIGVTPEGLLKLMRINALQDAAHGCVGRRPAQGDGRIGRVEKTETRLDQRMDLSVGAGSAHHRDDREQDHADLAIHLALGPDRRRADFLARMQAVVAQVLLQERHRAERLRRNRKRKTLLKRGDLDARIGAIADDLAVAVAASVIRHLRSRGGCG